MLLQAIAEKSEILAWMAKADGWTIFLLSASGAVSSMKIFIYTITFQRYI
jgi:hypothetical protein